MPVETLKINWRDQFNILEPYLDGAGGVLMVRYLDADRCAPNAFIQALTSQYEYGDEPGRRKSVRLDPDDYNTRFLAGIRETLRLKLGFADAPEASPVPSGSFGSNNDSGGGSMDISLTIHQHGSDPAQARELTAWRATFVKNLDAFLTSGQKVMIILGEGGVGSHKAFWRDLWHGGMAPLTKKGLCVVSMICDPSGQTRFAPDAPRPDRMIDLPTGYGAEETAHAIQDVAAIFETEIGLDGAKADAVAKTLVWQHQQNVGALHGAVPGMVLKWSIQR
jgi:hypothetical protein